MSPPTVSSLRSVGMGGDDNQPPKKPQRVGVEVVEARDTAGDGRLPHSLCGPRYHTVRRCPDPSSPNEGEEASDRIMHNAPPLRSCPGRDGMEAQVMTIRNKCDGVLPEYARRTEKEPAQEQDSFIELGAEMEHESVSSTIPIECIVHSQTPCTAEAHVEQMTKSTSSQDKGPGSENETASSPDKGRESRCTGRGQMQGQQVVDCSTTNSAMAHIRNCHDSDADASGVRSGLRTHYSPCGYGQVPEHGGVSSLENGQPRQAVKNPQRPWDQGGCEKKY